MDRRATCWGGILNKLAVESERFRIRCKSDLRFAAASVRFSRCYSVACDDGRCMVTTPSASVAEIVVQTISRASLFLLLLRNFTVEFSAGNKSKRYRLTVGVRVVVFGNIHGWRPDGRFGRFNCRCSDLGPMRGACRRPANG